MQRQQADPPSSLATTSWRHLLRSPPFYLSIISNILFSLGYILPPTYLPIYSTLILENQNPTTPTTNTTPSPILGPLLLALLSAPGVPAGIIFGLLSDGLPLHRGGHPIGIRKVVGTSVGGGAIAALGLWGFAGKHVAGVVAFAVGFGFFAGGFSACWSGMTGLIRRDVERRRAARGRDGISRSETEMAVNVDQGLMFGMFNGARGVGSVLGGLLGVQLLKDGGVGVEGTFGGFGSQYGGMILFTGCSALLGGLSVCWKVPGGGRTG